MNILGGFDVSVHPIFEVPARLFNYFQHLPKERVGTVQEESNNDTEIVDDKQEGSSHRHVSTRIEYGQAEAKLQGLNENYAIIHVVSHCLNEQYNRQAIIPNRGAGETLSTKHFDLF